MAVTKSDLARELHELIAALDRRVRRVEQAGEEAIARDAAALREKAVHQSAAGLVHASEWLAELRRMF